MCISLIANQCHPQYKLIVAFNRDENHSRLTEPLGFWKDIPNILAGRDLKAGGTWLGVSKSGRIANLTNYRDSRIPRREDSPSRGLIVIQYLAGRDEPKIFLEKLRFMAGQYNGFSLLAGDPKRLYYYSNIENKIRELSPGIYGLSNHLLDTPWKKVEFGKKRFTDLISRNSFSVEDLFLLLSDRTLMEDSPFPETGYGEEFERSASPLFVLNSQFGTRSSSVILIHKDGRLQFFERQFDPNGEEIHTKTSDFKIRSKRST